MASSSNWHECAFCNKRARFLQEHEDKWWHPLCWNMVLRGEQYR